MTVASDRWPLATALLAFLLIALTIELPADEDAFIYYRYAWNWAHGHGLAFNPGDPVEGFSGPAWMAILAALAWAGFDLPRAAPAIGLVCGALTLLATWSVARAIGVGRWGRCAVIASLALSYPFAIWSRSGLETPFYTLAIVVAVGAYLTAEYPRRDGRGWRAAAAVALVLVGLGRPEGILLTAVVVGDRLADRRDWAGALGYALPVAAGYGAYLVWRVLTFHALVPNTSVKLYPLLIGRSSRECFGYVLYLGVLPLTVPLLVLLDRRRRTPLAARRLGVLLAAVVVLSFFFTLLAGGDYRPGFRYLIPTLPLVLVAIWYAFELLEPTWPLARAALVAVLLAGPLVLLAEHPPQLRDWHRRVFRPWSDPFSQSGHWGVEVARWMERSVPRGSVVAFGQMGRVPYYVARRGHDVTFIDTLGLVDRPIAQIHRVDRRLADLWRAIAAGHAPGRALEIGRRERAEQAVASILGRRPDFVLVETVLLRDDRMLIRLVEHPDFRAGYREVAEISPEGPQTVRVYARASLTGPGSSGERPRPP